MKSKASVFSLALMFLFSAVAGAMFVNVAVATLGQWLPEITINRDGSVVPETGVISHAGRLYTLTRDVSQEYAIKINCSNIIFDGGGHIINGSMPPYTYGYAYSGLWIKGENVTIKDLKVTGFLDYDIYIDGCRGCTLLRVEAGKVIFQFSNANTLAESNVANLLVSLSNSNTFLRNNISALSGSGCGGSVFYENNFPSANNVEISLSGTSFWDNGTVGNYWGDYSERYPNASEIGSSGIGDIPYVIDANNIDNYPLVAPFIMPPSPEPQPEEPFSALLAKVASGVAIIGAAACVLYYHKKRRH